MGCGMWDLKKWPPSSKRGAGHVPLSDVQDRSSPPNDSELSDTDRAALEFAKAQREEFERRKWLMGNIGRAAKWVAAVIGFGTVVADAAKRLWEAVGR